ECDAEGTCTGITYYNRSLEKARTSYDTTHRFVSIVTYDLPLGKGRHWLNHGGVLNQVLGGWELTETQTLQSGPPFTVTFAGSPYQYLPGASRPNIVTTIPQATVQGWNIGPNRFPTSAQNPYLNMSSFAYPAAFTPGNLARNSFEAPGLNWMQVSLAKWWTIKEKYRFQLRLQCRQPGYVRAHDRGAGFLLRNRRRAAQHVAHRQVRVLTAAVPRGNQPILTDGDWNDEQ